MNVSMWRKALRLLHPDMPDEEFERNWRGLTRDNAGFTNQHGSDGQGSRFAIQCGVFCPGATLQIVDGTIYRKRGVLWVDVVAIDPRNARYVSVESLADLAKGWWFWPNAAPTDKIVRPFHNFGGRCVVPLFYEGSRMPVRVDRLIRVAKPLNPFVPPLAG